MGARPVEVAGARFLVSAPPWPVWQAALEQAAASGELEPWLLAEQCLAACVQTESGQRIQPAGLADADRDRLLSAALDQLEAERQHLALRVQEGPAATVVSGSEIHLMLRPATFGQRNDALRSALRLQGGAVTVAMPAFDRALILACAVHGDGRPVTGAEVDGWPVALGEAVVEALERLNNPEPEHAALLAACVRSGVDHPDLQLVRLCQTLGMAPAEALQLDARLAQRLLAAAGALASQTAPPPVAPPVAAAGQEGVTRILVTD